jgi:hypothetical protein
VLAEWSTWALGNSRGIVLISLVVIGALLIVRARTI